MKRSLALLAAFSWGAEGFEVQIPMRDGYTLGTGVDCDVTKPNQTVVMERSTYTQDGSDLIASALATALGDGYCSVRQDMRGTGKSNHVGDGHQDFTMWRVEGNDTYDTNEWIIKQNWSNGRILQAGVSSDGLGLLSGNMGRPQGLEAEFVVFASVTAHETFFPGGAYRAGLNDGWIDTIFPMQHERLVAEVRANEGPGVWWDPVNMTSKCERINAPSVFWAGWYDIFLHGNLIAYDCAQFSGGPNARGKAKLFVDPCGHCQAAGFDWTKDDIFGRSALPILAALDLFGGKSDDVRHTKDITFYVLGALKEKNAPGNHWVTVDEWPAFQSTPLYLSRKGALTSKKPLLTGSETYLYDPANPVQSLGGNNLMIACGPEDQRPAEERDDVMVFTGENLTEPVAITGPLHAVLYVSSNATDTDFTVKLTDVYPDGTSRLIQDGIVRMRWRKGTHFSSDPLPPLVEGEVYEAEVSLWNTSYVFNVGHQIRVSISSSNYDRFEPNPNTGRLLAEPQLPPVPAKNTIHFGGKYDSRFLLPVVPLSALPKFDVFAAADAWLAKRPAAWKDVIQKVVTGKINNVKVA